jgi:hypothetical protein
MGELISTLLVQGKEKDTEMLRSLMFEITAGKNGFYFV